MPCPDPRVIVEALALGVVGDRQRGLALLQPIVAEGPAEAYTVLVGLAETASKRSRMAYPPGTLFGCEVDSPDGSGSASVDVLPPPRRFAAQFITAIANRDQDMARALFRAVAEPSDRYGTADLPEAIGAVYAMAVETCRAVVAEAAREQGR
ncbi:hypothetical protein ACFWAP_03880 [Streptomyces goshikiensis]|uniref:hypothetical protein n=1 Tax=Streptomyces goshikiensis TaxID=1942 RepID=UPI003654630D